jgi:hypothetical protein
MWDKGLLEIIIIKKRFIARFLIIYKCKAINHFIRIGLISEGGAN